MTYPKINDAPGVDGVQVLPGIGWRAKTTPRCHIDVWVMAFGNLRIVETWDDLSVGRGWCYAQRDQPFFEHLLRVIAAAITWDGAEDTEPEGWIKEVGTGRRRPDGDASREYVAP
jgi:hypothetical protein